MINRDNIHLDRGQFHEKMTSVSQIQFLTVHVTIILEPISPENFVISL